MSPPFLRGVASSLPSPDRHAQRPAPSALSCSIAAAFRSLPKVSRKSETSVRCPLLSQGRTQSPPSCPSRCSSCRSSRQCTTAAGGRRARARREREWGGVACCPRGDDVTCLSPPHTCPLGPRQHNVQTYESEARRAGPVNRTLPPLKPGSQAFALAGFPGAEEEFAMALRYLEPARGVRLPSYPATQLPTPRAAPPTAPPTRPASPLPYLSVVSLASKLFHPPTPTPAPNATRCYPLPTPTQGVVVDVSCGSGVFTRPLAASGAFSQVRGR